MKQGLEAFDWTASRGEKWLLHLPRMEATLEPVDEPLFRALELRRSTRIAELGCGGGGTATALLTRAAPGTVVHGYDISPRLVEAARERARLAESAVVFDVADVVKAVPQAPYDQLMSRFGVMFFDDEEAAFGNLHRWLLPTGRFAFAVWGPPAENPWVTSVREVVARFVHVPAAEPQAPGPFRYADPRRLLALLEDARFTELEVHPWRGALPLGGKVSPADAARFALGSFSSFAELLAGAGDDAFTLAHRALTAHFLEHERDGAVWMDASVHVVVGASR